MRAVDDLELIQPPPAPSRPLPPTEPVVDEPMVLNIGPHHPSTHGVLRVVAQLDGERIVSATPDIGYLHTGIEKTFEGKTYVKGTTLAPRMSYLSPIHNNLAYVLAVEKLLDVEVPERATVVRVILAELDRMASHLVYLGIHALDLGASSLMLYTFRERESILDLMEMTGGARMFPSYIRPGGLAMDLPEGFEAAVGEILDRMPSAIDEYETLLTKNPFWRERTMGVARLSAEDAIAFGATGWLLRAAGIAYDLRKAVPYCGYESYDFEVPVRHEADAYARYLVRVAEIREAVKIARQALSRLPGGAWMTSDRKVAPPPKQELADSMEAVIHHFKLWTEGFKPAPGEAYVGVEAPRGELGMYVVSDGSGRPWRVHMRSPSFTQLQALETMVKGGLLADLVTGVANLDPVLGEVDR
ncbi:MAG: NADH-quinone oxidoreductase subunit D [Caldilineae bacterium]|nr:NADH-quinone oxidoreductase subunit D [Chloroflexota bacterium]MCB9176494.1 NADH-quinone oxidoreductase subunit D [Caldilineae bacterium]